MRGVGRALASATPLREELRAGGVRSVVADPHAVESGGLAHTGLRLALLNGFELSHGGAPIV